MSISQGSDRNWFDQGGRAYAVFRPDYPAELARYLASISPDRKLAVDVGCGTGQLTRQLAPYFNRVVGVDSSQDQIAQAEGPVHYICAAAESVPVPDHAVSLITAAQAAHWFDRPRFFAEARRMARPAAALVLISYGVPDLGEESLQERFLGFYRNEIGRYWPPERRHVDEGYAGIDFPFPELPAPVLSIERQWDLPTLLGYIVTWSAVRRAAEEGATAVLSDFARDLSDLWGSPQATRSVTWPINIRAGRL